MHIYAFGSICRGDLSPESDIDVLALVSGRDWRFDPQRFSIYSYQRMQELWREGNAFAWHLALESRLIFSEDGSDFIGSLEMPAAYARAHTDCARFRDIFLSSFLAIRNGSPSLVFELSTVFLAIRNLATCYSLAKLAKPTFARDSARRLGAKSLQISEEVYGLLMNSRLLSTRGVGDDIGKVDMKSLELELQKCHLWIDERCQEVTGCG